MKKTVAVVAGALLALGGAAPAFADSGATATGVAANSPGIVSGNVIQIPIFAQANVCGNTVNIIALLDPALANACVNTH